MLAGVAAASWIDYDRVFNCLRDERDPSTFSIHQSVWQEGTIVQSRQTGLLDIKYVSFLCTSERESFFIVSVARSQLRLDSGSRADRTQQGREGPLIQGVSVS